MTRNKDTYRRANRTLYALSTAQWRAKRDGYAPVDKATLLPRPLDGCCELCHNPRSLCIDHDHNTGCFRGWLCQPCNRSLGTFGDSVEGLKRAIDYLQRRTVNS
jgi:hypothetical protein